jgi:hypothetical protein
MMMEGELPVLHWLLREQAAEIFQGLAENHHDQLREFVCWFLEKAGPYTRYFAEKDRSHSFVFWAYGRPRYAAWARLAREVEAVAVSLGMPIPKELRLSAMPRLDDPTRAFSIESPVRISGRRVKRIQDAVRGADSEEPDRKR